MDVKNFNFVFTIFQIEKHLTLNVELLGQSSPQNLKTRRAKMYRGSCHFCPPWGATTPLFTAN